MKTVCISDRRTCDLIDKPVPLTARNYVLLKIVVAPMCNEYLAYRDFIFLERNRPDSLGHEMAGIVVDAASGASVQVGDRVVGLCGFPCGRCALCQRGYYSHCADVEDPREVCGSVSGECGFAQYAVKPDWMLLPIPADVSYEHASMACCALGPSFGAMERPQVAAFSTVLITGLGAVGLGGVINAKFRGATVVGVARTAYRAELAHRLGCDHVLSPSDDVLRLVRTITDGRGVDMALECSGQGEYQRLAIDAVGRLGTVVFLAEPGEISLRVDADLIQKGVTLLGSLDINRADGSRLMEMIQRVPEQIEILITHRYPLDRIADAFETQMARQCGKIVLYPWGNPQEADHRSDAEWR